VVFADADTTATFTHNLQVTTAELNAGFPIPIIYPGTNGTAALTCSVALTNSVAITITKANVAGSGGTFIVTVLRPHTLIR
jgi:hypothetical protein